MKDPSKDIRVGIVSALNGLLFNGEPIPCRDSFADNIDAFPRIIVSDIGGSEDGSKSQFMYDYIATIKISTRFEINGTSNHADSISSDILDILMPSPAGPYLDINGGFRIYRIDLDSSSPQAYYLKPYKYFDRNIRINIKLEQT